jgi:hypothetical protein
MTYPPDGCDYLVTYLDRGHEEDGPRFADEYDLGDWVKRMEAAGKLDRECDGLLFRIYAVAAGRRVPISLQHPRLVHGRIEKRAAGINRSA